MNKKKFLTLTLKHVFSLKDKKMFKSNNAYFRNSVWGVALTCLS